MRSWNELSMAEKADVMKLAIEGGVYNLDSIRSGYNEYAKGGKIHIDPSKRGTFTAAASKHGKSVQAFASQVLAHPENYSPAMRKKANFAKNASKWKHGDGGELNIYDEPQTFAGRMAEAAGASPSIVRGTDVISSVAQMTPWGHYIAATDLGRDLNRVYHKEKGAKKDAALDLLSMIPGISAPGLKAAENAWNTIRGNNKLRKALNIGIITGRVADFVDDTWGANKTSKAFGGNLFYPGGEITYGRPYYSYDTNGRRIDDTLNYNASIPEIVITPDSKKSPGERAVLERQRRVSHDATYGKGTYGAARDREWTGLQQAVAQKVWENSAEKKALDYGQAIASGIGIGADIVSRLPVYSSLKGARVLNEAKAPLDYIEGGLWLSPLGGATYQSTKPTVKRVANKIAAMTSRNTPITAENAASITPEQWDATYIKALDMGDKVEAQRLRDLHFKAKALNTKITTTDGSPAHIYHGTDANWVKYDASKFGSATDDGYYGVGLYGTEYRPLAKGYGDNVLDLYINAERPYTAGTQDIFGNPYTLDEATDRASVIRYFNRDREGVVFGNVGNYANTDFPKLLKEIDNADAAVYGIPNQRFNEVVIPRGEQIKLADVVTYDDAGNIIPLSKRDNFNINDIRYGLIPTAISTLGLSTYLNNKNK